MAANKPSAKPAAKKTANRRERNAHGLTPVPEAEARALLKERGAHELLAQSKGYDLKGAFVCVGRHHAQGDLVLPAKQYGNTLIVFDGDLVVDGLFRDTDADRTAFIGVLGDMKARDVWTNDFLIVEKDLVVKHTLYGSSGSNRALFVDGDLRAEVVVLDGHSIELGGDVRAKVAIDTHVGEDDLEEWLTHGREGIGKALAREVLTKDGELDAGALSRRMKGGASAKR